MLPTYHKQRLAAIFDQYPGRVLLFVLLVAIGGFMLLTNTLWRPQSAITTFAECKQASSSHMLLTYPEQCLTAQGKAFVQPLPSGPQATIHGTISITPSCAVPTPNPTIASECTFDPQLYTAYDIVAYRLDHKTIVSQAPLDEQGNYQLHLPAGDYLVNLLPASTDAASSVNLTPGQDLSLNLHRTVKVK